MSSSSGTRRRRTIDDKADDAIKGAGDAYLRNARRFSDKALSQGGETGNGAIYGPSTPGPSSLHTAGGTMIGSIAYNPVLVAISDGRINIEPNQSGASKASTYVLVTGQGSPDDLRFIDGADKNGQLLYLQGTETQIIILKAATISLITSISGLGTVTVQTSANHNLTTGDKVNILGTTNFDISNVSVTVTNPTEFTYSAIGNITSESVGFVQNGNIVTRDGNDIVIDGTISPNGIPVIALLFDPTVEGFGAWRPQSGDVSGGGITFPIDFPEDDRGTVGASTQEILFTDADRHSVKMIVSGDVDLAFSSPPTNETAYTNIIIVQDGTGGHTVTVPPGTVNEAIVNAGILTGPNEETGIVIKFAFGIFYAFLETGNIVTGGSAFSGNLSDLVIDVNKDWLAQGISNFGNLTGVTGITGTGASVVIAGIDTYDFFQAGQSIQNKADPDGGILYNAAFTQSHQFFANSVEIGRFAEVTAGVYRLVMLSHSIRDAKDITFDVGATNSVPGSSPGIGYDTTDSVLQINVPTGGAVVVSENGIVGSTRISDDGVVSDDLSANFNLFIGILGPAPTLSGQFTNDGTDVFVFSGGAVRNLSNISTTTSANTTLSNLTSPTSINEDLIPQAATLLGTDANPWSDVTSNKFTVGTAGSFVASENAIIASVSEGMKYNSFITGRHEFRLNNEVVATITRLGTSIGDLLIDTVTLSSKLNLLDGSSNPFTTGELRRNGSVIAWETDEFAVRRTTTVAGDFTSLNIVKVDASPGSGDDLGRLNFQVDDSGVITTYARIKSEIRDATDAGRLLLGVRVDNSSTLNDAIEIIGDDTSTLAFINITGRISSDFVFGVETGGTDLKIFPAINSIGIVVQDNISFTVGSAGTLAIPGASPGVSPTKAQLDSNYGDHRGAMGLDDGLVPHLYIRASNGDWFVFLVDSTITV